MSNKINILLSGASHAHALYKLCIYAVSLMYCVRTIDTNATAPTKSKILFMAHAGTAVTSWDNTGDTGPDSGNSSSLLPFYTSGENALFAIVNGAYQPVINMDVSLLVCCVFFTSSCIWQYLLAAFFFSLGFASDSLHGLSKSCPNFSSAHTFRDASFCFCSFTCSD